MRKTEHWRAGVLAFALCATISAWGYSLRTDDSGIYVIKWHTSPITMQIQLAGTANLIDGSSQRSSVVAAMNAWNAQLGTVSFSPVLSTPGGHAGGNGTSEIAMDSTVDGDAFPSGVLAVTIVYARAANDAGEADVIFNTAQQWNSYRGNLRSDSVDIQRVALHELGHVLGLKHPDEAGQGVSAIMNSQIGNLDALEPDDITGARALYGMPGVTVANDHFANATLMTVVEGTHEETTSNVGASRETGEPVHDGWSGVHSIWWKWTAPDNGEVTATTLGSNFDTVLAIYTGSGLSTLVELVANDDEEDQTANSGPQRKRTSKVSFNPVGGTTYYVRVDGFGRAAAVPDGYTGSIRLSFTYGPRVPPVFVAHPVDQNVVAGVTARLIVSATGKPAPLYRWQRLVAGGAWSDLADSSVYEGTATRFLAVNTTFAMDGDQLRCVATNLAGSATSNAATLRVTSIPLPVIVTQPQGGTLLSGVAGGFFVEATGATGYQWYRNGVLLSGQTGTSLLLSDPQPGDAGDYRVAVSNPGGSVNSATVTVLVLPPPVISPTSPARQIVSLGESLTVGVTATGTGALHYQWYHDGRPIAGATAASYTRPVTAPADAGAYWVAVTDSIGTRHGAPFFAVLSRAKTNVVGWGANYFHETEVPGGLTDAVAISAGLTSVVAVKRDGTVRTWGSVEPLPRDLTNVVAVSVGGSYSTALALKADGTVVGTDNVRTVPANLKEVWSIACGADFAMALKTDGTVITWAGTVTTRADAPAFPLGMKNVVAIAAGPGHGLALQADGTVVASRENGYQMTPPAGLNNVVALAGGALHALALKADGTVVLWGHASFMPAGLNNVVAIAAGISDDSLALKADGTVVRWNYTGLSEMPSDLRSVVAISDGNLSALAIREILGGEPPLITAPPTSMSTSLGSTVIFETAVTTGDGAAPTYQWQRDGREIAGATNRFLSLGLQPETVGLYSTVVTSGTSVTSVPAILGINDVTHKIAGSATEVGANIVHPDGKLYDQMLLQGPAAMITADNGQVARISYVDLTDDIIQVEFTGSGCLALVLDGASGPVAPANYNQPGVTYMKGHGHIVIAGATESTHVTVFSVGRANAVNQSLFREGVAYDGVADLAYIAILSHNGKFGGLRAANTSFFATKGFTGIYAPGVQFTGPVLVGDIQASDAADPVLRLGSAADVQINGGDLSQPNNRAVQVSGFVQLKFVAGTTSHGNALPAQTNKGRLEQNGADVTAQVVVNPSP